MKEVYTSNLDGTTEEMETTELTAQEASSLEDAQIEALSALADTASSLSRAVNTIANYTPTVWVDNSEPSINAARLNHIEKGIQDATAALNNAINAITAINGSLSPTYFENMAYFDLSSSEDIRTVIENLFDRLSDAKDYKVMLRPSGGVSSVAEIYKAASTIGIARVRNHQGVDYVGIKNNTWKWDSYATKSDLATKTITNFNSALSNGIYYAANNTSSSPVSDGHFMVYVAVLDSANASQIAVGLNLSGNTYIRTLRNGTWGAWKKVGFES